MPKLKPAKQMKDNNVYECSCKARFTRSGMSKTYLEENMKEACPWISIILSRRLSTLLKYII